jgi:hypothetical protein
MKILILCWGNNSHLLKRMDGIVSHHHRLGDSLTTCRFKSPKLREEIKNADLAYLFNGMHPVMSDAKKLVAEFNTPIIYMEVGWFPQKDHWYFDSQGTNGNSTLHHDNLDWLTPYDFKHLETRRHEYQGGRTLTDKGYILVPLQVPGDTAHIWSPFETTSDFIGYTRRIYEGREIIFRRHPKSKEPLHNLNLGTHGKGDLLDLICGASFVFGINSTTLLESALIGKKTISCGKSFLEIGKNQEEAIAALLARQVPCTCTRLEPWNRPGRGLETLRLTRQKLQ